MKRVGQEPWDISCDAPDCGAEASVANVPEWLAKNHFRALGWSIITTTAGALCYCRTHKHLGNCHFYALQTPRGMAS